MKIFGHELHPDWSAGFLVLMGEIVGFYVGYKWCLHTT